MSWTISYITKRYGNGGGSSVAERSAENREVGCSIHLLHSMEIKFWLICLCVILIRFWRILFQVLKLTIRLAAVGAVGVIRRKYKPLLAVWDFVKRQYVRLCNLKERLVDYLIDRLGYYLPPTLILWKKIRPALPNRPTYVFLRQLLVAYLISYIVWGCSVTAVLCGTLIMFLVILLARAIMPRHRVDQLVSLNWKILIFTIYLALIIFLLAA